MLHQIGGRRASGTLLADGRKPMDSYSTDSDTLAWLPQISCSLDTADNQPDRLPIPELTVDRLGEMDRFDYSTTTISHNGKLGDRTPVRHLGWLPGQPISLSVTGRITIAVEHPQGDCQVGTLGHLRLPAIIRHRCGIEPGQRLLVATSKQHRVLLVYPFPILDEALAELHNQTRGSIQ
ncbi:hypothetical protein IU500_24565 [Nocardia terpenica]|uniref:hypothetical protein n=1 Tax=Nocardia terpenica TaxID=455432 RepID=UPI00189604C2|nr:hypothetical protein [Nocardia terpenica]MBF6064674.1 hypothetical protein [Nocardia terpenica]MBF6107190.1 hypothetical protein [Nocardia terpenica]MBF6114948.1 hypothetical protein [Nocardia terpenica]MBF6122053.1 hypothetical protein [Nocardia terpenica]MBF6154436.1 hypothetical protein [Nocardia terpenica]